MTKLAGLLLSLALFAFCVSSLSTVVNPAPPPAALGRDLASPYRWCDLAEHYADQGNYRQARDCYQRALQLGPHLPQIWMRTANFNFAMSESDQVLQHTTRVLETVPDFDQVIFGYYDRLDLGAARIMPALRSSRRAAHSYFGHLLATGQPPQAAEAWKALGTLAFTDDATAAGYLSFLVGKGLPDVAAGVWSAHLQDRRGDYLRPNRLFNGGFENQPTGALLDWVIQPHAAVEAFRDTTQVSSGQHSLCLRFQGTENVNYRNTTQSAAVSPGEYLLRARIRTDEITTNEGVHLHLTGAGLDLRTEPLSGTHAWTPVELAFQVPAGVRLVNVSVCRDPSRKFDNKINGTAWIDDVSLVRR